MNYKKWTILLVVNLLIVACLGLLMRYKIVFSLPIVDQKHLQHAHSHFAFIAWISQALYLLLIHYLEELQSINFKKYNRLLLINTVLSYGMLISFLWKGYHISSNTFSFLLILNAVLFAVYYIKDSRKVMLSKHSLTWFYFALFFNVISAIGTFALVYMLMNKIYHQHYQLASVYFYLHFQYNGWFIATCMGLFIHQVYKHVQLKNIKLLTWIFCLAILPNYFLSILWFKIPTWLYTIVILSALAQIIVWVIILIQLSKAKLLSALKIETKVVTSILLIAFSLKLVLQLFSTIPFISHLAYSLRPIVIAYLHLVLLVIISSFILQYLYRFVLKVNVNIYMLVFMFFILINEFLLGIQGIAGMFQVVIPNVHYYLFSISIGIVLSITFILRNIRSL